MLPLAPDVIEALNSPTVPGVTLQSATLRHVCGKSHDLKGFEGADRFRAVIRIPGAKSHHAMPLAQNVQEWSSNDTLRGTQDVAPSWGTCNASQAACPGAGLPAKRAGPRLRLTESSVLNRDAKPRFECFPRSLPANSPGYLSPRQPSVILLTGSRTLHLAAFAPNENA